MTDTTRELRILFQDEGMAIVDKPSGVAVHKGLDRSDDKRRLLLDVLRTDSDEVVGWAWLNSHFEGGTRNALDRAILRHGGVELTVRRTGR